MKKQYFQGLCLLFGVFFVMGCQKSNEDDLAVEGNPSGITNLRATSLENGVLLSWENPSTKLYNKVEVWYLQQGEKKSVMVEPVESVSSLEISLPDAEVYKFHLLPFQSSTDRPFDEIAVKSRKIIASDPGEELDRLFNSIEMNGGDGGVRVSWENPENIPAIIKVSYDDQTVEFDAVQLIRIQTIAGLDLNRTYNFEVMVLFDENVGTQAKVFSVRPTMAFRQRLIPNGWTITASSEQAAQPAINLLDNNPATFWRSSVTVGSAAQYVIIDMKEVHLISALTFSRRLGNGENSSWDIRISTSVDGVNYTEGYLYRNNHADRPTPNVLLRIEFNRTIDGEQTYPLPIPETARYIKADFVRAASGAYAVYGDINIYGQ